MTLVEARQTATSRDAVAIKAFDRIADAWGLTIAQAARLADMSESTWKRARGGRTPELTQDQLLRFSALIGIYKALNLYFDAPLANPWIGLPNTGPLFEGATPLAMLSEGGLPAFLEVRRYLDALRGGM